MIISRLTAENFNYYNLHSEEVVTSNFIEDINQGVFYDRLQSITLDRLQIDIEENIPKDSNIAFDFKHIEGVQPNINTYFSALKKIGFQIVLLNITEELILSLGFDSIANRNNVSSTLTFYDKGTLQPRTKNGFSTYYLFEDATNSFIPENFKIDEIFNLKFKEALSKYRENPTAPHTSSFVYLVTYFNLKKFISVEKSLCMFSIYKLALKILKEWRENGPIPFYKEGENKELAPPILVCQSLNSAYLASILSNLLKLDILILDKIGPINRIYSSLNKSIIENRNYIVVSDLVCLGTEVKIVKNIIEFLGGKYLGNVALIKTETLKKKDIQKKEATVAVFSIDRTNNVELGYFITTDLIAKKESKKEGNE